MLIDCDVHISPGGVLKLASYTDSATRDLLLHSGTQGLQLPDYPWYHPTGWVRKDAYDPQSADPGMHTIDLEKVRAQVLDPHVIVLSGDVCAAGGQQLARRVKRELRRISKLRPSLMVSGVEGNPALVGALELSLHHTRDALFRASAEALVGNVR